MRACPLRSSDAVPHEPENNGTLAANADSNNADLRIRMDITSDNR
jgi:hypothetical protein